MKRRSTYTLLALAAGLLAVCLVMAVAFRPGARNAERAGGGALIGAPSADPRPLPAGAVARFGTARRDGLSSRKEVITAAYSADGKTIVAADWTGAANMKGFQLWDAETGAHRGEVPTPIRALFGVSLSPDGKKLAWGGNEGTAKSGVSDVTTGGVLMRNGVGHYVAFTPDGRRVVIGGYGAQTVVVDAASGNVIHTLSEPNRFAYWLALSRDGSTVVAYTEQRRTQNYARNEARVDVWDVATGKLRKIVRSEPYPFGLKALAVSSDGKTVAYNENKKLHVIDVATGEKRWELLNPGGNHVWEFAAFSPAGDTMIAIRTNYDGFTSTTYDLLDAKTGSVLRTFDGEGYQFNSAAFSPDGRRVITFGEAAPVRVWDTATGRLLPEYEGHRVPVHALAISGDGRTVLSADGSYSLCVWDGSGLRKRLDLRGVRTAGLSADGRTAIVTVGSETSTLVLDAQTGVRRVLARYQTQYSAISRDGGRAAVSRFGESIDVIDLASGKALCTLTGHAGNLHHLAFSADGRRVISAAHTAPQGPQAGFTSPPPPVPDETVRVWDAATGKALHRWELNAKCVTLSPDGRTIFAGTDDARVRRLDVATGDELESLTFHGGSVGAIAVSPDGSLAASADADGIVLWNPVTGRERKRLKPDHGTTAALAFTADGRRLASTGTDGTILMWDAGE